MTGAASRCRQSTILGQRTFEIRTNNRMDKIPSSKGVRCPYLSFATICCGVIRRSHNLTYGGIGGQRNFFKNFTKKPLTTEACADRFTALPIHPQRPLPKQTRRYPENHMYSRRLGRVCTCSIGKGSTGLCPMACKKGHVKPTFYLRNTAACPPALGGILITDSAPYRRPVNLG